MVIRRRCTSGFQWRSRKLVKGSCGEAAETELMNYLASRLKGLVTMVEG
jgi:hypothetical protein